MERNDSLKAFILSVRNYFKNPNETTTSVLQRHLGVLTNPRDINIFIPDSQMASEFYETLYSLISILTPMNPLLWSTLDLLYTLTNLPSSLNALIHVYKFPQLLSPFLSTSLIPEKRMKLLKLLKELTQDIKIHWQESHLPGLIQTLTQWINPSSDTELITLSLGLLINLCRKNPPAIYTLIDTINSKKFHKNLLRLQTNNSNIQLLCSKILLIMEETNYEIPEKFILNFVDISFKIIEESIENDDLKLLNETVDFFEEIRCHEKTKNSLTVYENYIKNVNKIVESIEEKNDEIIEAVSKFFTSIVKLKIPGFFQFHPVFTKIAIEHLKKSTITVNSLCLLKNVIVDSKRNKNFQEILSTKEIDFLLSLIISEKLHSNPTLLIELIQLIQELIRISNYRMHTNQNCSEPKIREIMKKIDEENTKDLMKNISTSLYINVLSLISDLSSLDSRWLTLYTELIQNRKIQLVMAISIFTSDFETKLRTLSLISSVGFNQECISGVTKCLIELENILLLEKSVEISNFDVKIENFGKSEKPSPYNWERLDAIIEKMEKKIENNEIQNVFVSEVMELFDFKVNGMKKTEENLKECIISAERNAIFQQHKIARIDSELKRNHELLFSFQKNVETLQIENSLLRDKVTDVEKESKKIHESQRMEIHGLKKIVADKSRIIEEFSELKKELEEARGKIEAYSKKIKELEGEKINLRKENNELLEKNQGFMKNINKLQESVAKRESRIQEKTRELEELHETTNALKQENVQLMRQCKSYESTITEKEETLKKLNAELTDFSRMRDMIYQLTAHKKDNQNETT